MENMIFLEQIYKFVVLRLEDIRKKVVGLTGHDFKK